MSSSRPSWKAMSDDQQEAFIRAQMAAGKSFGQMAQMFCDGSRSAILGKRHRLAAKGVVFPSANPKGGVIGQAPRKKQVAARPSRRAPVRKPAKPAAAVLKSEPAQVAPDLTYIPKAGAFLPIPGTTPIPIFDLPNRLRCRWPVDVAGQELHFACGATTATEEHVYCAPHRRLAVRGAQHQGAI